MNKEQAIELLKAGEPLRHRLFTDDEAIIMSHGLIQDGQGNVLHDFWEYRTGEEWNTGWKIAYQA